MQQTMHLNPVEKPTAGRWLPAVDDDEYRHDQAYRERDHDGARTRDGIGYAFTDANASRDVPQIGAWSGHFLQPIFPSDRRHVRSSGQVYDKKAFLSFEV